jgi:hypothetical protein
MQLWDQKEGHLHTAPSKVFSIIIRHNYLVVMQTAHCFSKANEVELQPSFGTRITLQKT